MTIPIASGTATASELRNAIQAPFILLLSSRFSARQKVTNQDGCFSCDAAGLGIDQEVMHARRYTLG
ncbi:MAG TPA: hypothetical protein VHZ55_16170 [Bryobacteraceae bacterium]|jgi:hypothetical protein|nr:hypothetical protein [Bryobacteraceae bacterium]